MILIKHIVCTFLISIGLVLDTAAQIQVNPDSNIELVPSYESGWQPTDQTT